MTPQEPPLDPPLRHVMPRLTIVILPATLLLLLCIIILSSIFHILDTVPLAVSSRRSGTPHDALHAISF